MAALLQIQDNYWKEFSVKPEDIENIYNVLLEKAVPLPSNTILDYLINMRIQNEMEALQKQKAGQGKIYLPKENYKTGEKLAFPNRDMEKGKVAAVRDGFNPDYQELKVIDVEFESGKSASFAANIEVHPLNHILDIPENDPNLDPILVKENYGEILAQNLDATLAANDDLVKIAGSWFPRSLLVDVHVGHLNLAEAVLEEAKGGPISTSDLMKQVELLADVDKKLLEFSFDLALQDDDRFDEVGPSGETLWFLKELEPNDVKEVPLYLKFPAIEYETEGLDEYMDLFEGDLFDEHEPLETPALSSDKAAISLTFPHWRSGTLPLPKSLKKMFPSAYEAPRVKFTFIDSQEDENFSGWVVRDQKYIHGLDKWYDKHELMPGSLVYVARGDHPGEIKVSYEKSRQNKEWIKTVLVGSDQVIVFAMLKHPITASFNERMAVAIPDLDTLDELWKSHAYNNEGYDKTIIRVMRELAKLNPQHQVHAQELYAAVNVVRRCPPSLILFHLLKCEQVERLGDLYFRIGDKE